MSATKSRCAWAQSDALMQSYHDEEWGVPDFDSRSLWETLMLEGFQAGLAWIIVLRKRDAFRKAFRNFDPKVVARFGEKEIAKMLENPGIIRSRAKIEATIGGARAYLEMKAERASSFRISPGSSWRGGRCRIPAPLPATHTVGGDDFKGAEAARLQVCGSDDCVCVDAGRGDGERSRGGLLSVQGVRAGGGARPEGDSNASLKRRRCQNGPVSRDTVQQCEFRFFDQPERSLRFDPILP